MLRVIATTVAFCALLLTAPARAEVNIQPVTAPQTGIEAWLVQDAKIPVVALSFSFEGGTAQDPANLPGVATLAAALLTEGAGQLDSQAFLGQLEDNSISLDFGAGRDTLSGRVYTLKERLPKAEELLRLALTEPRIDAEPLQRLRRAQEAALRQNRSDPESIASDTFFAQAYPDHPYGRPQDGVEGELERIDRVQVVGYLRRVIARDGLQIAAAGDISPEELGALIDRVFGAVPATGERRAVPAIDLAGGGEVVQVALQAPQSVIMLGQPGIRHTDPDWIATHVMNYILGGGGFSSRLMNEIREKRGLTYGVRSYVSDFDSSSLIWASLSTQNANAGQALDLLRAEWQRIATDGVSEAELRGAQSYMIGSYPLRFGTTPAIASGILQIKRDGLGLDYPARREEMIAAVTVADIQRVAQRLLSVDKLLTVIVGSPEGVTPTRQIARP